MTTKLPPMSRREVCSKKGRWLCAEASLKPSVRCNSPPSRPDSSPLRRPPQSRPRLRRQLGLHRRVESYQAGLQRDLGELLCRVRQLVQGVAMPLTSAPTPCTAPAGLNGKVFNLHPHCTSQAACRCASLIPRTRSPPRSHRPLTRTTRRRLPHVYPGHKLVMPVIGSSSR